MGEVVRTWRDSPTGPPDEEVTCSECGNWERDGSGRWGQCAHFRCETREDETC